MIIRLFENKSYGILPDSEMLENQTRKSRDHYINVVLCIGLIEFLKP
jgi:hypothetical protein